jgi:hypothetical protein
VKGVFAMQCLNRNLFVPVMILLFCVAAFAQKPDPSGIGRTPTAEEIKARDISISTDGKELPPGSGTAKQGAVIFAQKCAVCHGPTGEESRLLFARLVGGTESLTSWQLDETAGGFWPYATSIWDFINRAMPEVPITPDALPPNPIFTTRPIPPGETDRVGAGPMAKGEQLKPDEVYALTAWILFRNGTIKEDAVMDRETLPKVVMANRNGWLPPADLRWTWVRRDPKFRIEPHVSPNSKPLPEGSKPVNAVN